MGALFDVNHLSIGFAENGKMHTVVNDISFSMGSGEILGVVGESGSGKSMTALASMGLLPAEAYILGGEIRFDGNPILTLSAEERSHIQGNEMSMIFQEPMTSLNPVMKIGRQVGESLLLHTKLDKRQIHEKVVEALSEVGLSDPEGLCEKYPHELSGGMRQRVMIAQAMICSPKLLIADEPTTALDVIVQEQILCLLKELHEKKGISILFISHDLNVIREICQNVLVMYQGDIVEQGSVREVLYHPKHAYTKTLVASIPEAGQAPSQARTVLWMEHLNVYYREKSQGFLQKKKRKKVVKDLSLEIYDGEIMGIVGESGCGKSTLAKALVGLNRDYEGSLRLGEDIRPQMVFQDPYGSLNPSRKIGWIMSEPLRLRGIRDKSERKRLVLEMLEDIGLDASYYDRHARELSGGQRQRVSIGTALLMDAKLLVADEPVSALDVTVQSQILKLLLKEHEERNLTILFISHDLNIVRHFCHRVAVIYLGEIVEMADVEEIYQNPCHPYTRMLFEAALTDAEEETETVPAAIDSDELNKPDGPDELHEPDVSEGSDGRADRDAMKEPRPKAGTEAETEAAAWDLSDETDGTPWEASGMTEASWMKDIEDVKVQEGGCAFAPRCRYACAACAAMKQELRRADSQTGTPHLVRCGRAASRV